MAQVVPREVVSRAIAELQRFLPELKDASDRVIVVVGAAFLDDLLAKLIAGALLPEPNNQDELLYEGGPLSTLSARILLAYRLGAFDAEMSQALHLVRRIRNDFAHDIYRCSLNVAPHSDRLRSLAERLREDRLHKKLIKSVGESGTPQSHIKVAIVVLAVKLLIAGEMFKITRAGRVNLVG